MANFFIDRPIFAWVLAILLCLTGTLAIFSLPVEQYPDLAPPNVRVTATIPAHRPTTLENNRDPRLSSKIMTGLDNLMYMSSQSSGTGQASVTLSFKVRHRSGRSRAASTKPAAISHAKVTAGGAKSGRDGA